MFSGACRPNARKRHGTCLWIGGVTRKSQLGQAGDLRRGSFLTGKRMLPSEGREPNKAEDVLTETVQ